MTLTVKLDAAMEQALRQRSAALGRSVSDVVRDALRSYLDTPDHPASSPYALGHDLFGRHRGPADLAEHRKDEVAALWAGKQDRRAAS